MELAQSEHGAFAFDKFEESTLPAALQKALDETKQRLEAIRHQTAPPTFENTIEAINSVNDPLEMPGSIFSLLKSLRTNDQVEKWGEEFDPKFTQLSNAIYTDATLFARVEAVHQNAHNLKLNAEQAKLLKDTYLAFVLNGAKLNADQKKQLLAIEEELTRLNIKFKKNVLDATNAYSLVIRDRAELSGLPESAIAAAAQEAKERDLEGAWVFTLQMPSLIPFLSHADNRARREELWRANQRRATSGETDNRPILLQIAKLRHEKAVLLGFKTHAHLKMEDRMAKSPENVNKFLDDLADLYRPHAQKDFQELQAMADFNLEAWDIAYYSEKLRVARYSYRAEDLRPYFRLDNVLKGAFFAAQRLYGVTFSERPEIPVWDPSVRAYEVRDAEGKYLALFYLDPFPRKNKRQGAWMTDILGSGWHQGAMRRPHVLNAGNLTPPVEKAEALLTLSDVHTVFHEMGHGLHSMMSRVRTPALAGTNVTWDFVELPSQFFENWALEDEVLDVYARHKDTNERIPAELVAKVKRARHFQSGMAGLRQILLAKLDLAWHQGNLDGLSADQVEAWEARATEAYRVMPRVPGMMTSTTYSHIFTGGYSAGYYSYKWAELLAADAFEYFKERGVFDREAASRFLTWILEKGGTEEADELYRKFRGRNPDPKALPRSEGLIN